MATFYEARLGRVVVIYDLLEQTLGFPEGTTIRRVTHDELFSRACELVVHSPDLPKVPDGLEIPIVTYTVETVRGSFQL